ncbi:MAG: hypothetical protein MR861_07660 [Clostridiales bacterium]|nr:hypothetical protein [Clostridiales bacterium]
MTKLIHAFYNMDTNSVELTYFNFVDDVDIPIISEPITTETTYGPRKTA